MVHGLSPITKRLVCTRRFTLRFTEDNDMFTLGADPEMLLVDSSGNYTAACGRFGGTKQKPRPLAGLANGFAVQEDNVMLEFNVPPASSGAGLWNNIETALSALTPLVTAQGLHFADKGEAVYGFAQLSHPGAEQFGCSPDYDGHNNGRAVPPVDSKTLYVQDGRLAFAGGHIHLGYGGRKDLPPFVCAQFCDAFVGLRSVALDVQGMRRTLYGRAGRYRPTAWGGIEYRTLSNFWIADKAARTIVCDAAEKVATYLATTPEDAARKAYNTIPWHDVREAIERQNVAMANDLSSYVRRITNV